MRSPLDSTVRPLAVLLLLAVAACGSSRGGSESVAPGLTRVDRFTLAGPGHLLRDHPPVDGAGNLHAVIEIPAGTNAKWEVDERTGRLVWEREDGEPRWVAYLPYPGNYGMVPGTRLPRSAGGDGDPLDVIVLGPALPRGAVVKARAVGVLRMRDDGEADHKILAVSPGSPLGGIASVEALDREFPGVTGILETWFTYYKGGGRIETLGYGSQADARELIERAAEAFRAAREPNP